MDKHGISPEEEWHLLLQGEHPELRRGRHLYGLLPSDPRCKFCNAPFEGLGGQVMRTFFNKRPSTLNPTFCNMCDDFTRIPAGGAEVEISMLFADVRGSTTLAERIRPSEFSRLINRFYAAATSVLIHTDAWIDKLVGDEVIGLYIPGFAGPRHAYQAVQAAQDLLRATGHASNNGPWLPVGIGVHTGTAYVGLVGSEGVTDITALGDAVNTTARLASNAGPGEILVSDAAYTAAGLESDGLEQRHLNLKGREEPVQVRVMTV